ncbi:MAG: malectin domain-containing carbohydrate-binding protein [Tepidisphaeraceae bacterium]
MERRTLLASSLRIDAGGAGGIDSAGQFVTADSGFAGGHVATSNVDIANASDDALFQSSRVGTAFDWSMPVDNGHYALILQFADVDSVAPGQRVFDISVEGSRVIAGLDVFSCAGPSAAFARSVPVTVTDGRIDVRFSAHVGEASVAQITLLPTDVPDVAAPYSWRALSDGARRTMSLGHLRQLGQDIFWYAGNYKGSLPTSLEVLAGFLGTNGEILANPMAGTDTPRGEMTDLEASAWSASLNDFVLAVTGGRTRDLKATTVLAYENPDHVTGDIGVLWGDGHVTLMPRANAASLIGFPNVRPTHVPPVWTVSPADPLILQSQDRLRQLGSALRVYETGNNGTFPSSLGMLYLAQQITDLQTFLNPRTSAPQPPSTGTPEQIAAWIDQHAGYAYFGGRSSQASNQPLLCERPDDVTGGINVGLSDGTVVFREFDWADQLLERVRPTAADLSYNVAARPWSVTGWFFGNADRIDDSALQLVNLSTGNRAAVTSLRNNWLVRTFSFGDPSSLPADGVYRLTIPAESVRNALGRSMRQAASIEFTVRIADFDRDGIVGFTDLLCLARNFGSPYGTLATGDANGDGVVNFIDLILLASRYGSSSPTAPAGATPMSDPNREQESVGLDVLSG